MDARREITWIPFQSLERPPHRLSWCDLDRAAFLEAEEGVLLEGFYALRKLTRKVPFLWPLVPIFWLPGMHVPGRVVYRWVAANRYRLSRCAVPDRRRGPDGASAPSDDA
jgi:predicted DCC family thiol-disulfide oxidoreductase YuxK